MSDILFLSFTPTVAYTPNIVDVDALTRASFDYDGTTFGTSTNTQTETVVIGGAAEAIANATASLTRAPGFPFLVAVAETFGAGLDEVYEGISNSRTEAIGTFEVSNGQPLSFSFSVALGLLAKEIEDPGVEFSQAIATTSFLILDTSNGKSNLLDDLTIKGDLISSQQIGEIDIDGSDDILDTPDSTQILFREVDGDNGFDSLYAEVNGTYEKTFDSSISQVTVVHVQTIETIFAGDTLIGNLGPNVQYGTIGADTLNGNGNDNKLYGSLGDDRLDGQSGDDILEGGRGDDILYGKAGDDQLNGGAGDDRLKPNKGNDIVAGGAGRDLFIFGSLRSNEIDTILDFEVGLDKIHLPSLGNAAKQQLFDTLQDTAAGAQLTVASGGKILIAEQTAKSLGSAALLFV